MDLDFGRGYDKIEGADDGQLLNEKNAEGNEEWVLIEPEEEHEIDTEDNVLALSYRKVKAFQYKEHPRDRE